MKTASFVESAAERCEYSFGNIHIAVVCQIISPDSVTRFSVRDHYKIYDFHIGHRKAYVLKHKIVFV